MIMESQLIPPQHGHAHAHEVDPHSAGLRTGKVSIQNKKKSCEIISYQFGLVNVNLTSELTGMTNFMK